jgi:ornithine cyclodeaminase/alanine dehydrogenase-like protein (mu-crystallin family)
MHHSRELGAARFITEGEVRQLLRPDALIDAIEAAFRDRFPSVLIPARTVVPLPDGVWLIMPCCDPLNSSVGVKFVMVRENPSPQPRVQATYLLLDPDSSRPRVMIEADYLTDLRTAATSAVATKFLAAPDAATLGIFGIGRLARAHINVLPLVRNFKRILVCGRDLARTGQFVAQIAEQFPEIKVAAADARTCAAESEVLCACTSSATPVFDGNDLRPGTHVNLTGAFQPQTREADSRAIQRGRLAVDAYGAESGDLLIPVSEGVVPKDHVIADLHELVSGKKPVRRSATEITIFKSVGCALEDLVATELLMAARV